MTAAEDSCRALVDIWAAEVRGLVRTVQASRQKHEQDCRAADYGEDWSPTEQDLIEQFGKLWASQHHLVWAAHQLERWVARLAQERGEPVPTPDPVLADLRNALEHLDEAELDEFTASAGSSPKANRSLRRLPGSQLLIGSTGSARLFGLVDPADIEHRAFSILTTSDMLMDQAQAWVEEAWVEEHGWPKDDDPSDEHGY